MLRLLQWIFIGHTHHWKEDSRQNLIGEAFDGTKSHIGYVVACTCKTCGKPKLFKLR